MTPTSPVESVPAKEPQVFETMQQLPADNIAETPKYEVPTYLSNNKVEGGGKDKNEGFYISKKMMKIGGIALATIFLGGGAFFGIKAANNGNNNGETGLVGDESTEGLSTIETSDSKAIIIDSEESQAVVVTTNETVAETAATSPEIVAESIAITLEQETPFEVSGAMPIEEFAKLSYADRAAWAVSAGYSNIFDYLPEDINEIDWTDAPSRYWFNIQAAALAYENPLDRQKLESVVDYYLCDNETGEMADWFKENANYVLEDGGQGELPGLMLKYISDSELKQDQVGPYVEITYEPTSYSTGEATGKKQTVKAYAIVVKMLDGTTINTCARGALIEES